LIISKRNNKGQIEKLNNEEVVKKLKNIFRKEKYSYNLVKYNGSRKNIKIFCFKENHGFFERRPEILYKKRGCFLCLKELDKKRFIEKVQKIHKDKYDYSLVNYINYHTNINVICDIKGHGNFQVTPDNHQSNKSGCPICGRLKSSRKRRKKEEKFLSEIKKIFKNKYSFEKVNYQGAKIPVIIICKKHGEYPITPDSLLQGRGCFDCGLIEQGLKRRSTTLAFINAAKKIHGNRYNYSQTKYETAKTHVTIICNKHKEFEQLPTIHLTGAGCNDCGNETIGKKMRNPIEKVIRILEERRGNRNFDYSLIYNTYKNNRSLLSIRCTKHNKIFFQSADDHAQSGGCEDCKYKSIGEELVMAILSKKNIEYVHNWSKHDCILNKGKAKFDFYLPHQNLIIEYDGEQHFKPVQYGTMTKKEAIKEFKIRKKFDIIKNNWAKRKKINFLRIKYNENTKLKIFNKLEKLMNVKKIIYNYE